ncbi:hypothetical protein ACH4ZU_24570 [Streptomyces sp. NPDC020472]|uniref:hypothetical protein n=1 Tax=Streptomyces sp. NPDC020472 TaxID=3365075 RepID=UPI0037A01F7E
MKDAPFPPLEPGDPLVGAAVGEVVSAPDDCGLRPGDLVSHWQGWREYATPSVAGCTPLGDTLPDPVAHLSQGWTAYAALTRGAEVRRGTRSSSPAGRAPSARWPGRSPGSSARAG